MRLLFLRHSNNASGLAVVVTNLLVLRRWSDRTCGEHFIERVEEWGQNWSSQPRTLETRSFEVRPSPHTDPGKTGRTGMDSDGHWVEEVTSFFSHCAKTCLNSQTSDSSAPLLVTPAVTLLHRIWVFDSGRSAEWPLLTRGGHRQKVLQAGWCQVMEGVVLFIFYLFIFDVQIHSEPITRDIGIGGAKIKVYTMGVDGASNTRQMQKCQKQN